MFRLTLPTVILVFIGALLARPPLLPAQQLLTQRGTATIRFGPKKDELGLTKANGQTWKPLFFSVSSDGTIYIPDFYKGRIARYSAAGAFIGSLPVSNGISPRMNFFERAANGDFVTFDDHTLFCLNSVGSVLWKHPFPVGTIPSRVFLTRIGIFLLFPGGGRSSERTFVISYSSPRILGSLALNSGSRSIPVVSNGSGPPFALVLGEMHLLPGRAGEPFDGPANAVLLRIEPNQASVWSAHRADSEGVYLYTRRGRLRASGTIVFPGGGSGNGFWTYLGTNHDVYLDFFTETAMTIARFRLPRF